MKPTTPKELFPDGFDSQKFNGVELRKGSIGTCLRNAALLEQSQSLEEKKQALKIIKELAPAIEIAFQMSKLVTWKNPEIQKIFDEAQQ